MCKLMGYQPIKKYQLVKVKNKQVKVVQCFETKSQAENCKWRLEQIERWMDNVCRYDIRKIE